MLKKVAVPLFGIALLWGQVAWAEKVLQFVLPDIDGGEFSLEEELGKGPILFDFWATWCKPCIKSLAKLQAIERDYKEKGVRVFTINIDGPHNQAKIRPFTQRHKLKLPVLIDRTSQVMKQFQLLAVPSSLIVSSTGKVVYKHQGYKPGDEKKWRQKLDELLAGAEQTE
jgi:cytochrome c biogenesis protein CcmG/thiol:disulfide interchange protein DsbE